MASTGLGHIRERYGVPAFRGRLVSYEGRRAIISRALGSFVEVQFAEGGSRSGPLDPRLIDYAEPPSPPIAKRAPFRKFVRS